MTEEQELNKMEQANKLANQESYNILSTAFEAFGESDPDTVDELENLYKSGLSLTKTQAVNKFINEAESPEEKAKRIKISAKLAKDKNLSYSDFVKKMSGNMQMQGVSPSLDKSSLEAPEIVQKNEYGANYSSSVFPNKKSLYE